MALYSPGPIQLWPSALPPRRRARAHVYAHGYAHVRVHACPHACAHLSGSRHRRFFFGRLCRNYTGHNCIGQPYLPLSNAVAYVIVSSCCKRANDDMPQRMTAHMTTHTPMHSPMHTPIRMPSRIAMHMPIDVPLCMPILTQICAEG